MKDRMTLLVVAMLVALVAAACGGNANRFTYSSDPGHPASTALPLPPKAAAAAEASTTAIPTKAQAPAWSSKLRSRSRIPIRTPASTSRCSGRAGRKNESNLRGDIP